MGLLKAWGSLSVGQLNRTAKKKPSRAVLWRAYPLLRKDIRQKCEVENRRNMTTAQFPRQLMRQKPVPKQDAALRASWKTRTSTAKAASINQAHALHHPKVSLLLNFLLPLPRVFPLGTGNTGLMESSQFLSFSCLTPFSLSTCTSFPCCANKFISDVLPRNCCLKAPLGASSFLGLQTTKYCKTGWSNKYFRAKH